jgi:hypothetical protein
VVIVVDGGDASDYLLAGPVGEKEFDPGVLVERVLLRVELPAFDEQQRRHPVRVVAVLRERIPDKAL